MKEVQKAEILNKLAALPQIPNILTTDKLEVELKKTRSELKQKMEDTQKHEKELKGLIETLNTVLNKLMETAETLSDQSHSINLGILELQKMVSALIANMEITHIELTLEEQLSRIKTANAEMARATETLENDNVLFNTIQKLKEVLGTEEAWNQMGLF
ncbi:hypothetical protein MMC20_007572 [Loxospora ochrophaea]|nr:hypothetical protein [Loxospora ochrophaea]